MTNNFLRMPEIDILRGLAILGVVIFHIVWDLEFTGLISGVAFHPVWLGFGRILAGTFMFLVGVSLVLAHARGFKKNAFIKRLATVALAALAISFITWFAFPNNFVFFGILHAIVLASLTGLMFLRMPVFLVITASMIILFVPRFIQSSMFDTRWLAWVGIYDTPPSSNDFVPFFPWVGLTILGIAIARLINLPHKAGFLPNAIHKSRVATTVAWMGKQSLPIYLIHQPVLLAIIIPMSWMLNRY